MIWREKRTYFRAKEVIQPREEKLKANHSSQLNIKKKIALKLFKRKRELSRQIANFETE